MKRIYMMFACLLALSFGAKAQSTDLALYTNLKTGDTIIIDSVNTANYILVFSFVNKGTTALTSTDKIHLATEYQNFTLSLPAAGMPVNDTLYFVDTVGLTNGPATGAFTWCDSLWATNASDAVITDPVMANNYNCKNIFIKNRNGQTGIGDIIKGTERVNLVTYPNPTANTVSFKYNFSNTAATVRITDIAGRVVMTKDFGKQSGEKELSIDVSALNNGMYYLELVADDKRAISKITVQK
jgi:hypothetical protein